MEIWLRKNEKDGIIFPVNPPTIGATTSRNYEDIILASGNEKTVMGGKNLQTFSFSSFIPYRSAYYQNNMMGYVYPKEVIAKIEKWLEDKTVLQFQVTKTLINKPITIRNFEWNENHVGDIDYSIELKEYQPVTVKMSDTTAVSQPAQERPESQEDKPSTHTVTNGDTLWILAKKYFGDGSQYTRIYETNKTVIGANPNLIKPGQVLVIPK